MYSFIILYSLDSIKIIPHVSIIYFKWHHFKKKLNYNINTFFYTTNIFKNICYTFVAHVVTSMKTTKTKGFSKDTNQP